MPPLAIDLYCGLGGWSAGLLAEGYHVVGFDRERHVYGEAQYPAQLVLQDVLTIHGRQFKDAALIVASPPCQEFSYMAMPWRRAKQIAQALYARKLCGDGPAFPEGYTGSRTCAELTALFDACFRIQREACEAAGRHIPLVVENVCGAQKWVGRARWHYGSFYLWGDMPALMPIVRRAIKGHGGQWFKDAETADGTYGPGNFRNGVDGVKVATMGAGWYPPDHPKHVPGLAFNTHAERATNNDGGSNVAHNTTSGKGQNPDGRKVTKDDFDGYGGGFGWDDSPLRRGSSKSNARKAASAHIARIPLPLARWIARAWHP